MANILLIPDAQVQKGVNLDHIYALGNFIVKHQPEYIVNLGDWYDMHSLNIYDKGKRALEGARYQDDIDAGLVALDLLEKPLIDYNINQTIHKKKQYRPTKYFLTGNHECFPENTEVLTLDRGWVNIKDVVHEDLVLTQKGNWQNPKYFVEKYYEGYLKSHESRTISLQCTPDHRILYTNNDSGKVFESLAKNSPNVCDLFVSVKNRSLIEVDLTWEQLAFNAIACTDSYHRNGKLTFFQSGEKAISIRHIIKKCNVLYKERQRIRDITSICGKVLKSTKPSYEFYMDLPNWCHNSNKYLPKWVFDLSDSQFEIFLDWLIFCDGTIPTGSAGSKVFYGKKKICDDVQAVCVSHGYRATLTEYRENQWRVNITKTTKCRVENFLNEEEWYEGIVYCLGNEDESFLIRQNNKPVFVGNCRISRHVESNPILEDKLSLDDLQLKERGWVVYPFLEVLNINEVYFSHYFVNPDSAKNYPFSSSVEHQLVKLGFSFIQGHRQGLYVAAPRYLQSGKTIRGIVCGSFYSHEPGYLGPQGNSYWRGALYLEDVEEGNYRLTELPLDYLVKNYS